MALSFSFPIGKVKKGASFGTAIGTSTTSKDFGGDKGHQQEEFEGKNSGGSNNSGKKGPKSWKSFPSLSFFKDSTSSSSSNNTNTTSSSNTGNVKVSPVSRLPIRTTSNPSPHFNSGNTATSKNTSGGESSQRESTTEGIKRGQGLILENLTRVSTGKSLPDVTDTESPKPLSSYPAGKPCDLLAQLQSLSKSTDSDNIKLSSFDDHHDGFEGQGNARMEKDVGIRGAFDDNGNPCDLQQQQGEHEEEIRLEGEEVGGVEEDTAEQKYNTTGDSTQVSSPRGESNQGQSQSHSAHEDSSDLNQSSHSTSTNGKEITNPEEQEEDAEPPRYFINAAALSEDDNFIFPPSPTPSPCNGPSQYGTMMMGFDEKSKPCTDPPKGKDSSSGGERESKEKGFTPPATASTFGTTKGISVIRPRVPVSKSYPDIIQTTFNNDEKDKEMMNRTILKKENSDLESLVADSLENLGPSSNTAKGDDNVEGKGICGSPPSVNQVLVESASSSASSAACTTTTGASDKPFKAFDSNKPLTSSSQSGFSGLMNSSSMLMSESQMGGLFAEKPPEAWVIDFNSLSLESEIEHSGQDSSSSRRKSNSGSNSNSLAFFVNIDDDKDSLKESVSGERRNSGESTAGSENKKIFSMFVDIEGGGGGGDAASGASGPSSNNSILRKPVVLNKPVINVMERSTGSIKSMNKRFPSPIFQHKAAAEAARKAARMEWEKQREKYFDSLEPNSLLMAGGMPPMMCGGGGSGGPSGPPHHHQRESDNNKGLIGMGMGESTSSNRSSLHVANVLESSFSSSIISSMENSQPAELELCQGGPCFKLGKDLLRMFQEGINTDVNINVHGKWIKAHKCILASRSQYFAAILSGHWVEKAGNTISLDGFSYGVVQFALYHIYSGTNEIPDTIDLLELATLTDLLGLEGLRENISQTFRVKLCHNFHRPCTGCITGVLECFPIASTYGMDDLHRKMIKWICKHFVRIWPTKGFASLGDELIEKCLRYSVNHLSVDNILDHTLGCDQLLSTMPTLRWTEPIFSIVNQLAEECVQFLGEHLCDVLQSQKFLQFGKGQAWNISRIEGTFVKSMSLLKADEACLSHTALSRLIELGTETIDEVEWSTSFVDFLKMLRDDVERFLFANASKAVLSRCWEQLGQDVRKRICSSSFVGYDKFGNKIVKNTGGAGKGSGNRPNSASSARGGSRTLSKQTSAPVKPTQHVSSTHAATLTKVASVRPMQSHHQQSHPHPNVQPTSTSTLPHKKSATNSGRTVPSVKSENMSDTQSSSSPPTATPRSNASTLRANSKASITMDREKSFNSRRTSISTASSSASANRTPMKPLTPSIPSKPSPLTAGYDNHGNVSCTTATGSGTTTRTTKPTNNTSTGTRTRRAQPKAPEPPKKTFLTNSAKAAAVSKPLLKPTTSKKTPSSSVSSLNSQPGTTAHTGNASRSTSNASQGSRYLTTTVSSSSPATRAAGGFSARSSFSNVERPHAVKSKVDSNPPRRNTYGQSQGHTTIPTKVRRPASSGATVRISGNKQANTASGHSSMPPVTSSSDYNSLSDSYSRDNIMSRSTIETESGEVKMRTLAEIGRSSTFSKDEPTILGKMDGSTYGNLDVDYDEYE